MSFRSERHLARPSPGEHTHQKKSEPWVPKVIPNHPRGLSRTSYEGTWDELPNFDLLTPQSIDIVEDFGETPDKEFVALVYEGYLKIDANEMYEFALTSDDGSRLLIGGIVVVDNDGLHGAEEERGSAPLAKGWHPFRIEWFNKTGGASLHVRMGLLGGDLQRISAASFAVSE